MFLLLYLQVMSTPKFHTLKVKDIRRETADCISVAFEIPTAIAENYSYKPGQYITIKKVLEEELRRSYSICSAPKDKELRVAIKKVTGGVFSTYANDNLKIGEELEVMEPMGHFYPNLTDAPKNYFGFASGSGITPIMSILKTVLEEQDKNTFTLVYGNKNLSSIIFKEEIEALKNTYMQRLQVVHILSRERLEVDLNYGRINTEKCTNLFTTVLNTNKLDEAFICGPEQMVHEVKDFLIGKGIAKEKIKFELFGTGIKHKQQVEEKTVPTGPISKVSVKVDDRTFDMDLAFDGNNILDEALQNGADLPYACKGGVCCTCKAKIVEGKVKMTVNYALSDEELAQGYVLTCQAHPITDKVVVDFDDR